MLKGDYMHVKCCANILNINDNPDIREFTNEFLNVEKTPNASGLYNKLATQMSGNLAKVMPCRILHFRMDANHLREVARKYGITVSTYILCLMFISAKFSSKTLTVFIIFSSITL